MGRKSCTFLLTVLFALFYASSVFAQGSFLRAVGRSSMPERGMVLHAGAGLAAVKSEICGSWGCNDIGSYVSLGALYKFSSQYAVNGEISHFRLGATEKVPYLNLSFQTDVIQVSGSVVIHLLDSYSGSGNYRSSRKRFIVPYVKAGGGFIYYTATSFPAENTLDESQATYDPERNYPAIAGVIPFGGGLRFRFSDHISIAPEMMYHYTTTDYLDNIGPRINTRGGTDHFGIVSVKVLYTPGKVNELFSRRGRGK